MKQSKADEMEDEIARIGHFVHFVRGPDENSDETRTK
jgi:hypothetical protein